MSIPAVLYVSRAEDSPLSDQFLRNYATWWQLNVMKPVGRKKVLEIVMDGHEKIATKCGSDVPKKDGRPRKSGAVRHYNNGWFMAMNPADGKILIIEEMFKPEDNKVALRTIQSVLSHYKNVNATEFKHVKYWIVDKFHAKGHVNSCPCSPLHVHCLKLRVKHVNASISEQVFSWFRGYSHTFNSMARKAQRFYVHLFAKKHNSMIRSGLPNYLNKFAAKKKTRIIKKVYKKPSSSSYACNHKGKVIKHMKVKRTMRLRKVMKAMQ